MNKKEHSEEMRKFQLSVVKTVMVDAEDEDEAIKKIDHLIDGDTEDAIITEITKGRRKG